jgi:hypothetical protein
MAILKFRVYLEEDDSVYRDVAVKHTQTFLDLHTIILKAFEFDSKHAATFYRSNDNWQRGRELSLEVYDKPYKVAPLLMNDVAVGTEIKGPNQKFIYEYDFVKHWTFHVALISVSKEEAAKTTYPTLIRAEGIAPSQYGTKSLLGERFADVEEKYDLSSGAEGFGVEGEEGAASGGEEGAAEAHSDSGDDY